MRYTTLLLDFHNTLTNNRARLAVSLNNGYQKTLGRRVPPEIVRGALQRDPEVSIANFVKEQSGLAGHVADRLQSEIKRSMESVYVRQYTPVLKRLTLAIVTNSEMERVMPQITAWEWDKLITAVFARGREGNISGLRKKPSPDSINFAIETLSVKKDTCLMVGDHVVDIDAATSARIDCAYLVTGTSKGPESLTTSPTLILYEPAKSGRLSLRDLPNIALTGHPESNRPRSPESEI